MSFRFISYYYRFYSCLFEDDVFIVNTFTHNVRAGDQGGVDLCYQSVETTLKTQA